MFFFSLASELHVWCIADVSNSALTRVNAQNVSNTPNISSEEHTISTFVDQKLLRGNNTDDGNNFYKKFGIKSIL